MRVRPLHPRSFARLRPAATLLLAAAATCGDAGIGGPAGSSISLSSDVPIVVVGRVANLHVTGDTAGLIWSVNGVRGGDASVGTIDQAGRYTAPSLVPLDNPVHIGAANSGAGSAQITLGVSPAPAQGVWSISQPRAVTPGAATPVVFVTNGPPGTTDVRFVPRSGAGSGDALVPLGGTLYQRTMPVSDVLATYTTGDLHAFVGFLDYYAGGAHTMRGNLFVNVRDGGVPSVTVTQPAADVQRSDHVVNIRYDSLFLGGQIPPAIPRRFYQLFGDDYDFLGVVEQADIYANRNYQSVKNTERGFGAPVFDNSSVEGSAGRLLGMVDFPIANYFDLAEKAALHEIGHRWMVYLPSPFSAGGQSHWGISDMAYGMMGFSLAGGEGGDFNFTITQSGSDFILHATPRATHYNDLELYLMGLAPASEVGPHVAFTDQNQTLVDGGKLNGPATAFSIDDLVAALGPRTPAFGQTKTSFSFGTIVLSAGRLLSADEMAFFDHLAARGEATVGLHYTSGFNSGTTLPFALATNGRGQLSTAIH